MPSQVDSLRGYVICSQPRSGTNYLCELLTLTGELGRPLEYFNGPGMRRRFGADYPDDVEAQFAKVLPLSTTPNGVYGLKLASLEFDRVAGTRWADRLPNLKFIHLERLDYLGQAISRAKALQTGWYRSNNPPKVKIEPSFDGRLIREQLEATALGNARWRTFFARNAIKPLHLTYEALAADPIGSLHTVAELIGVAPKTPDLSGIRVQVQRNDTDEAWRAQFIAQSRDLRRLDQLGKEASLAWAFRRLKARWLRQQWVRAAS